MVSMSYCANVDCIDLHGNRQALESSIVAWLKKESNSLRPSSVAVNGKAVEQLWWLSIPKYDCNPSLLPRDFVESLQMHARRTDPLKVKSILQSGKHDCSHQVPPFWQTAPSLASEWTAELPTLPVKFGVQLYRSESTTTVQWTIDAKKMRFKDRVMVSSPFLLPLGGQLLSFRMMLVPTVVCKTKRGHCFKLAQGRGSVQLKCEASDLRQDANRIQYAVRVGRNVFVVPKQHVRQAMLCGLPRDHGA